jgi:hypothetical protein
MSAIIDYEVYSGTMGGKVLLIKAHNISFLNDMIRFELNGIATHWFPVANTVVKRLTK